MNNPGIDLATWERLRTRWSDLQSAGHKVKIEFHLIANPENAEDILAIDVIQQVGDEILTETVQRKAGEAYQSLGIVGLSLERLVEAYKELMREAHQQAGQPDADLIVTMSPSSPTAGEVSGYLVNPSSGVRSNLLIDHRHYYVLNELREKMVETTGGNWKSVKAVYHSGDLEFCFEY